MTTTKRKYRVSFALATAALFVWASPATSEDCGSPCTVTRQGLPTFRLINSVDGVDDWDLETSAFGVELAPRSDSPNTGAFRVEHGAFNNTLVISHFGRIGINTSVPAVELQVDSTSPRILLNDVSPGGGQGGLALFGNMLGLRGNAASIMRIDTRSPLAMAIDDKGNVALSDKIIISQQTKLYVDGDARVNGNVTLGSSRTLKTGFDAVDPAEVLAKLADLPVASWRYKTEDESARHIGPFAEDFQRLFGLGDSETISVVDSQGVALAAIQGLKQLVDARDARITELEARLAVLEAHLVSGTPLPKHPPAVRFRWWATRSMSTVSEGRLDR